ncbi:Hsp70 family protein [Dactylosporangium sp. CA-092794]|uniref:Hsp70 family protein n=1 Tax=Dactylosporangium sp. CA-092794 TaxID=3239929 RepID=UPI003D906106
MAETAVRLGIDFGTFTTVAVLAAGDGEPQLLLFDGSPLLRSAVCADPTGHLVVGRDALHLAAANPAGFEPHPKRCVDEGTVLLAGAQFEVEALFAAVLDRVVEEATRVAGAPPTQTVVTCPAGWGAERRAVLRRALPPGAVLVPEPVAAAFAFARRAGVQVPEGGVALVYDLGAGTFDASLVRRGGSGFTVLATGGLTDTGGLDIDAALVGYLARAVPRGEAWERLTNPGDAAGQRLRRQLWDNVRTAKEMLSRSATTLIHLPLLDQEEPLGREQLERVAAPMLERTVAACREVLNAGRVEPGDLSAVFLVGGASRMPAIATALHRALGVEPSIVDQPELAVAMGSLPAAAQAGSTEPTGSSESAESTGSAEPAVEIPHDALAAPAPGSVRGRRGRALVIAAAAAAVLAVTAAVVFATRPDTGSEAIGAEGGRSGTPSAAPPPSPSAAASPSLSPGIDACLLGTWRLVSSQTNGILDNTKVQYTNGAGVIRAFREDGAFTTDYGRSAPIETDFRGAHWTVQFSGAVDGRYFTKDGKISWTGLQPNGTSVLYRNGKEQAREKIRPFLEDENYVCQRDRYGASSTLGNYSEEWARVAG